MFDNIDVWESRTLWMCKLDVGYEILVNSGYVDSSSTGARVYEEGMFWDIQSVENNTFNVTIPTAEMVPNGGSVYSCKGYTDLTGNVYPNNATKDFTITLVYTINEGAVQTVSDGPISGSVVGYSFRLNGLANNSLFDYYIQVNDTPTHSMISDVISFTHYTPVSPTISSCTLNPSTATTAQSITFYSTIVPGTWAVADVWYKINSSATELSYGWVSGNDYRFTLGSPWLTLGNQSLTCFVWDSCNAQTNLSDGTFLVTPVTDSSNLHVTLTYPPNALSTSLQTLPFNYTVIGSNTTYKTEFYIDGTLNQTSVNIQNNTLSSFNLTDIPYGNHTWKIIAYINNTFYNNSETRDLQITTTPVGTLSVALWSPSNNTTTNENNINFSFVVTGDYLTYNATFALGEYGPYVKKIATNNTITTIQYNNTPVGIYWWFVDAIASNNSAAGATSSIRSIRVILPLPTTTTSTTTSSTTTTTIRPNPCLTSCGINSTAEQSQIYCTNYCFNQYDLGTCTTFEWQSCSTSCSYCGADTLQKWDGNTSNWTVNKANALEFYCRLNQSYCNAYGQSATQPIFRYNGTAYSTPNRMIAYLSNSVSPRTIFCSVSASNYLYARAIGIGLANNNTIAKNLTRNAWTPIWCWTNNTYTVDPMTPFNISFDMEGF